jgi:hypothetical protein
VAAFPPKLTVTVAPGKEIPHTGSGIFCWSTALSRNGRAMIGSGSAADELIARQMLAKVEAKERMQ